MVELGCQSGIMISKLDFVKLNQVAKTNPFYLLQRFESSCTHFQATSFSVNPPPPKKKQVYHCKNTVTKNNEIQLIIMDIIQSYYTLSNTGNGTEMMLLFNIGLSRLINKLSLNSNKTLLPDGIKLSADGLTFLKVNGEMPMCSPELTFKCRSVSL